MTKAISFRLEEKLVEEIDNKAKELDRSRNWVVVELLESGLHDVQARIFKGGETKESVLKKLEDLSEVTPPEKVVPPEAVRKFIKEKVDEKGFMLCEHGSMKGLCKHGC